MKIAALALLLFISGSAAAPVHPVTHGASIRLGFDKGICSGTSIGPHKILSASHCWNMGGALVSVNGYPVTSVQRWDDGRDHTIVVVTQTFRQWATVRGKLTQGQAISFYGNAVGLHDLYRRGYVAGVDGSTVLIDCMVGHGDSGAGLFDARGYLVGVVSYLQESGSFRMLGAEQLNFSADKTAA